MNGAHTVVLTGAAWVLRAVSGPGGRDAVYGAQCTTCRQTSGQGSDAARSVAAWAVEHTRAHPDHRSYVSLTRTQWRVDPETAPPASAPVHVRTGRPRSVDAACEPGAAGAGSGRPPHRPAHHAAARAKRRRAAPGRLTRTGAFAGRFTGPLYLAGLCTALGVVFGAVLLLGKS